MKAREQHEKNGADWKKRGQARLEERGLVKRAERGQVGGERKGMGQESKQRAPKRKRRVKTMFDTSSQAHIP